MTEELKKYKLYYLQKKYNKIVKVINEMEDHYNDLFAEHIIDSISEYSNVMYDLIKNLNSFYNSSINYYFENNTTDIDLVVKSLGEIDNNILVKVLDCYLEDIPTDVFTQTEQEINNLIKKFGYKSIKKMIDYLYSPNYFNKNVMDLINEIDDIVIPISYNIFDVNNMNVEYYWRVPAKYDADDIFHKKRELWIKIKETENRYLRIDMIFKI